MAFERFDLLHHQRSQSSCKKYFVYANTLKQLAHFTDTSGINQHLVSITILFQSIIIKHYNLYSIEPGLIVTDKLSHIKLKYPIIISLSQVNFKQLIRIFFQVYAASVFRNTQLRTYLLILLLQNKNVRYKSTCVQQSQLLLVCKLNTVKAVM